ncbi:MAG: glycosyltransferase family 1 protein, partial [Spirochaetaceae bacterium]|nr:glycosyltransferase family 1 protein [Spirochaetaceae bacterium]
MKIVILTNGTRGDIQPLIYLGQELHRTGCEVVVVASENFALMIEKEGLIHHSMPVNMQEYMETEEGRLWMKKLTGNPFVLISEIKKMIPRLARATLNAYWTACQGADLIITTTGALGDIYIKNHLYVPLVEVHLQPLEPTCEFAYPLINFPNNFKILNKFSYFYFEWILGQMFRKSLNTWQKETFGSVLKYKGGPFAERRRSSDLKLGAYSSVLIAKPWDWPENYHICGSFLSSEEDYTPEPKLKNFILSGKAPVFIGFGSMIITNPDKLAAIIKKIVMNTDERIIFARGWSSLDIVDIPDRLLVVQAVSHKWLFPRMAGIIHHGGAGTTAASLRAGVPQMIFPKTADQPFWGKKVHALGISP